MMTNLIMIRSYSCLTLAFLGGGCSRIQNAYLVSVVFFLGAPVTNVIFRYTHRLREKIGKLHRLPRSCLELFPVLTCTQAQGVKQTNKQNNQSIEHAKNEQLPV